MTIEGRAPGGARRSTLTAKCIMPLLVTAVHAVGAQATFQGRVLSDPDERPLPNAEVRLPGLTISTRSDSAGAFHLSNVPAGVHPVFVRLAGYQPWSGTVEFRDGQSVDADILLKPVVVALETVTVTDRLTDRRLLEFNDRRSHGPGKFLTADVFERNSGRLLADVLLGNLAGLRAEGNASQKVLTSTHDGIKHCAVQVVLNGLSVYNGYVEQPEFDINSVNTGDVLGIEFYTVATTPQRFNTTGGPKRGSACGTVVIWTR